MHRFLIRWLVGSSLGLALWAQHAVQAPAFDEAASGARKFQLMSGLKLDVWAAEPQLSNSVAFCFDGRGRVFLAESDRWAISVFDITAHTNWLWQDMSFRTVADRAAFLTNEFSTNLTLLTKDSEVVRMLEDSKGTGRADRSVVVASGFNSVVDGTAAGVLVAKDSIYFANIPSLWRLPLPAPAPPSAPAENGNLKAENLASGFGVHIGVSGHDLHGLIRGPDGRIYVSFGDRGCVLTNREGRVIHLPDTGGVLRCEPDGRNLEVFCYGLRNPQELAFDDLGNLWTVDNDTAGADPCRVLHLVEGADYGWRTSYQHMDGFGPWVQEELWKGGQDGILPPAGTVSQGPSGLAYYPGTGFGERLKGTFLHADFPGGVAAFTVKPQGASYVVDYKERFLWNCWPTDVDFGPDGAAYVLDWVSGWGQTPRGRIYRITPSDANGRDGVSPSPSSSADRTEAERVAQVRRLLAEGMAQRIEKELLDLLGNPDRRVRLEAQWELAGRGSNSLSGFVRVAKGGQALPQRLHALWGVGQILRDLPMAQGAEELASLLPLLSDPEPEIRGQAARLLLGEGRLMNAERPVTELFSDPSLRVRRMAVQAFSQRLRTPGYGPGTTRLYFSDKQKVLGAVAAGASRVVGQEYAHRLESQLGANVAGSYPVIELAALVGNAEGDLFLLDAASGFFRSYGTSTAVFTDRFVRSESPDLRKVALLALRRLTNHAVTNFLADSDPGVVTAAGRAIHDVPIASGFPALASFITKVDCPTNLYSRVIDACYRLGTQQHAQMLAGFAAREDVPDWARVMALRTLGDWEKPAPLDRVNGLWRPLVTLAAEKKEDQSLVTSPSTSAGNPLLERAAQAQAGRNLGRAAEVPQLPEDLGRSVPYAEAMALRRNPAPARRAYLRVAGDLLNPFNLNEAGVPAGTREVLALQIAVAETAARLGVKEAGTPLYEKFSDSKTPGALRQAIVPALAALNSPMAGDAVKIALADRDPKLRTVAIPYVGRLEGGDSATILAALVPGNSGERPLAQAALLQLGRLASNDVAAAAALRRWATNPEALPVGQRLDLREALRVAGLEFGDVRGTAVPDREFLEGGDEGRGREIFFNHPAVQCLRCHRVSAEGGTVGPELTGIGGRQSRAYLLESIVHPNAQMAAGFESVVLMLTNGQTVAGTLKRESGEDLEFVVTDPDTGEARPRTVRRSDVVSRERGPSAMPEGLAQQIRPLELRDLVEYLASLK